MFLSGHERPCLDLWPVKAVWSSVLSPSEGGLSATLGFTPKHQIDKTGLPQPESGQTRGDGARTAVFSNQMAGRAHVALEERIVAIESRLQGASTYVP
jgi:hypothetical protein